MKIIRELLSIGQCVGRTHATGARIPWAMEGAVNDRRLPANVFHDIDLTAIWPACRTNVVAQHPKRRPDSLSKRYFDSRFKPPEGLRELEPGKQPRRSVITAIAVRTGKRFS